MNPVTYLLVLIPLTAAFPQSGLHFRNMYKPQIKEVEIKPNPRIIGGQEAVPHSIPYQAFMEVRSETQGWYCGGSLISQLYLLTAGHCGADGIAALVVLGAHKPSESESTQVLIVSTDILVHPNYDSESITNDVGIIKFPEAVTLTDAIQLVLLPSRLDIGNTFVGTIGRISGWGVTDYFGGLSDVLNYVDVEIISNEQCEEAFGTLLDSIICTSEKNETNSCNGDSGGPLVVNGVQVGTVSFGIGYCLPGYPSGFSRLTSFLDWIEENSDVVIQ